MLADKFDGLTISSPASSLSQRLQWVKDPPLSPTQPVRSSQRLKGQPAESIIPPVDKSEFLSVSSTAQRTLGSSRNSAAPSSDQPFASTSEQATNTDYDDLVE